MKVFIKSRLLKNPFISANKLYDAALIFMNSFYSYDEFILGFAPSYFSLKTSLYRWKAEVLPNGDFLAIQNFNFNEFILPNGHNTLIFKGLEIHKMIIMGDLDFIGRFAAARNFKLVLEGTFKPSSNSFFQLYIIRSDFNGQSFPLVYISLSSKTGEIHVKAF